MRRGNRQVKKSLVWIWFVLLGCAPMLTGAVFSGCGWGNQPPPEEPKTDTSPIVPPKPTEREKPPATREPVVAGVVSVGWKVTPRLAGDGWKTRERGIGTPVLCRINEKADALWCYATFAGAWVEVWQDQTQTILDMAHTADGQRLALLLKDSMGSLALQVADAPFLSFRTLRTFPAEQSQPALTHISFQGEELIAYGKGTMLSERSEFLTSQPGAEEMPILGKMAYVHTGYFLAIDQTLGVVVQNAADALTRWSPTQLPEQGTEARALHLATHENALAMVYNDGSVYWRCEETMGLRLVRLEQKVARAFWFHSEGGKHLAVQTARDIRFITTGIQAPLQMPDNDVRVLDAGAIGTDRLLLQTSQNYFEGTVKLHLSSLTCPK